VIKAAKYFKMSADQGDAIGRRGSARCVRKGTDFERNVIEAVKHFKMSPDQGNLASQYGYALRPYAGRVLNEISSRQ
jgi:TPR repeat protein